MGDALLRVENLGVAFATASPVRELSFSVQSGETLAIVGESGSGKSLTALSIMRLLPRSARMSGRILFSGADITALSDRRMRALRGKEISMIFQEPMTSLNPVATIGRQVMEVLQLHEKLGARAAREKAREMFELVRIPARRIDDYPHQLSGGMRQRVMIAMAVACNPKLLIADEPTTALDVTIQAQILELLDRLRAQLAMGVLLITHDLGVVAQWADRVVVMYAGRKVEEAIPEELMERPLHPYTRGLMGSSPRIHDGLGYRDVRLAELPGSIASAAGESGCAFRARCSQARPECAAAVPPVTAPSPGRLVACPYHG